MNQRDRRQQMPESSAYVEAFFREFSGLHSFTLMENGRVFTYPPTNASKPALGRGEEK